MTLIKCPECSSKISESARHCPRCGFPLTVLGSENNEYREGASGAQEKIIISNTASKKDVINSRKFAEYREILCSSYKKFGRPLVSLIITTVGAMVAIYVIETIRPLNSFDMILGKQPAYQAVDGTWTITPISAVLSGVVALLFKIFKKRPFFIWFAQIHRTVMFSMIAAWGILLFIAPSFKP